MHFDGMETLNLWFNSLFALGFSLDILRIAEQKWSQRLSGFWLTSGNPCLFALEGVKSWSGIFRCAQVRR